MVGFNFYFHCNVWRPKLGPRGPFLHLAQTGSGGLYKFQQVTYLPTQGNKSVGKSVFIKIETLIMKINRWMRHLRRLRNP